MDGDAQDPQLHSHVVVTSAVRDDGRIVAVASRPIFRSRQEVGAYYRSALAYQLTQRGYAIDAGTGTHGRYFEIAGVPRGLLEAFSARRREVARAAERFRARYGRAPERGELRRLKLENRKEKIPATRSDLQQVWDEKGARVGFTGRQTELLLDAAHGSRPERALEDRVEERLTERAATFEPRELRAALLEQSVGELSPQQAVARATAMIAERRIVPLEGGRMTTLAVRAKEQAIERRVARLAEPADREVGETAREIATEQVNDRIAAHLSNEQTHALRVITGPERAAVLIGPAGTGKGVVIDAAARAEQLTGRETVGVAVSWSTAERLGRDSPALAGQTFSVDALTARVEHGRIEIGSDTTIYFDEAGMADTTRLDQLTEMAERTGAKLVAIGDSAQLPSIGAGGMFDRLSQLAPSVEITDVRRTMDPAEQRAWADLRAGRSDRALAHYLAKHNLHMTDTRDQAVERAVRDWAKLTEAHPISEIALISDASNKEIDRLNARAQHYRTQRGELGDLEAEVPGVHYGIRKGDRIALIEPHHERGKQRIENGSRGQVLDITPAGEALIEFDLTGEQRALAGEDLARLRLAYAQHIHRAQGATVTRTLVVTGGWQTSKEPAYVEASRARQGTDWYVNRDELGTEGHDTDRIKRLAHNMSRSHAQTPSLAHPQLPDPEWGTGFHIPRAPSRSFLPGAARAIHRIAKPPPAPERTR
jgi:hypothetical protein